MNVHPLFAWSALLPADTSMRCIAGPSWLRDICDSEQSASKVAICWGGSLADTQGLAQYDAWAGFNVPPVDTVLMRHAGFTHVRRYAVMPSARNPRWFIPLDSPAVAGSALELLQPVTRKARMHRAASRMAVRAGLKCWHRDTLTLVMREQPRLERAMQADLPDVELRLAIGSGSVTGGGNRKITTAVIDTTGQLHGFAKLADTPLLKHKLQHEADVLDMLSCHDAAQCTPRKLFAGEVGGMFATVVSPVPGDPARPQLGGDHHDLLSLLRGTTNKSAATTGMVFDLQRRTDALTSHRRFGVALEAVMSTLQRTSVPMTIVHGDFTPWNLRQHDGIIYAFDWEQGHLDGLPLIDELHHEMAVGYLLKHWSIDTATNYLERMTLSEPLGLQPHEARAIVVVYMVDYLTRLVEAGHDDDAPRLVWYERILERLMPASTPPRRPEVPNRQIAQVTA